MRTIVCLNSKTNKYGVYVAGYRNSYGTPLAFVGTLDECVAYKV